MNLKWKNEIKNNGITLISLVITIIVLLILAGITIAALTGDNGILTNTKYAKFATEIRSLEEQVTIKTLTSDTPYFGTVNDLLSINSKYNDKLLVEEDELKYIPNNSSSKEIEWFEKLGIEKISDYYTIKFITYNNSETITQKVKAGNKVKQPDAPKKEGYDFLGWYYLKQNVSEDDSTYEEIEFDFNTEILSDYTLYAKYSGEAIMRAYDDSSSPLGFYEYKNKIKHISFEQGDIPNDLPELSWNVRANNNCTDIIAYLKGNEEDGYDLTIISTKIIYANANSGNYFNGFSKLETINFDNFDTSKSITMHWMFNECRNLKKLDLSTFDTSNVNNMQRMFGFCDNLETLDLSSFNTNNVNTMYGMFWGCKNLYNLNLSNFNTSNVTTMANMFRQCNNLTNLNLSNFDTLNVTTMENMFRYSTKLTTIYVKPFDENSNKGWNINSIINTETMFLGCPSLVGGAGTKYNENNVDTNYAHIDQIGNPGYLTEYK